MFPIRDVNPTRITPFLTVLLIAASLLVFFGIQASDTPAEQQEFLYRRAAIACEIRTGDPLSVPEIESGICSSDADPPVFPDKEPWSAILTSMFLHGGLGHVLFNMWFLWIFGNNVEEAFGHVRYLVMYVIGGIAATLVFVVANPDSTIPLVGASGAIAAVLGAYAVLFPAHRVLALVGWFLLPVPAALLLAIWFVGQFGLGGTGVAWEAHVGGFVFGLLVALVFRRSLLRRVSGAGLRR
jgi:membrane associated rhomboid family serine protease